MDFGYVRPERQRPLEALNRFGMPAQRLQCTAAVAPSRHIGRLDGKRLVEGVNCFSMAPKPIKGVSLAGMSHGKFRISRDGAVVAGERLLQIAALDEHPAEQRVRRRVARPQRNDFSEQCGAVLKPAGLTIGAPQQEQRVRIAWLAVENFLVSGDGFGQPARLFEGGSLGVA